MHEEANSVVVAAKTAERAKTLPRKHYGIVQRVLAAKVDPGSSAIRR